MKTPSAKLIAQLQKWNEAYNHRAQFELGVVKDFNGVPQQTERTERNKLSLMFEAEYPELAPRSKDRPHRD